VASPQKKKKKKKKLLGTKAKIETFVFLNKKKPIESLHREREVGEG